MGSTKPYLAVIFIQIIYAGMILLSKAAFNGGMNSYVFVFYRQMAGALFMSPLAMIFERMEKVKIKTAAGIAKVAGLGVSMIGVAVLCFYKGPQLKPFLHHHLLESHNSHQDQQQAHASSSGHRWMIGCFLLLVSIICWSLWLVLQAQLLVKYPAKLRFTSLQCLSSAAQSFVVAIALERDPSQWNLGWNVNLLAIAYCGIMVTGFSYYLQAYVIEKKGPVFQAMSQPLNLIITVIGSVLLLGEAISLGSVLGGILLAASLYSVLWGKSKEQKSMENRTCLSVPVQPEKESAQLKEAEATITEPTLFV
ncbi:WAT1-related protein At5g64700 isoform X2 [Prunus dulcis]|uniref:WAT1-related protein At5g64700 isoform X2 n=1 Tax=Prunus dulcis TaxID=3755 RepID=UPI001481E209|nr:WAT1-related protein At5g64700 isoform X2 [Prunus dulcis]